MKPLHVNGIPGRDSERGFMMLLAVMAAVIPLFLVIGATTQAMVSRQSRLRAEVGDERSLAAAESGVDYCIYRASTSLGLTNTTYTRDMGNGESFSVAVVYLRTDGVDNDGDGSVDEVDETIYRAVSAGSFSNTTRRIVAYIGPLPAAPKVYGALQLTSSLNIEVIGSSAISGTDMKLNGSPGPGPNLVGMAMESPSTVPSGVAMIQPTSRPRVTGKSAAPSVGPAPAFDWDANQSALQSTASTVLTTDLYNALSFGNAATGDIRIIYRSGDVTFRGVSTGAGIMYVEGDLRAFGTFRFDGIIYVKGNVYLQGNSKIYGAVVCDTNAEVRLQGNTEIRYSSEAINKVSALLSAGKFVLFNGWQELSRN